MILNVRFPVANREVHPCASCTDAIELACKQRSSRWPKAKEAAAEVPREEVAVPKEEDTAEIAIGPAAPVSHRVAAEATILQSPDRIASGEPDVRIALSDRRFHG